MIYSMTGYGKAEASFDRKKIVVEIKSLNSKQLDLQTRIAPHFREKEMEIRQCVAAALVRGKVELSLWVEHEGGVEPTPVNATLVENYYRQLTDVARQSAIPEPADWMSLLVRMPDVLTRVEQVALTDEEWAVARQVVRQALDALVDFRRQEGEALYGKFCEKIDNIERLMAEIEPWEKSRVEKIRQRIAEGLASLPGVDYDKGRLEQELIYYIEKLDISEEKQRLANHLRYFRETLAESPGQGKKLGFIAQEMGREINTTGSKSNQAEMQNLVVQMKDELEQIKEQVLNVL